MDRTKTFDHIRIVHTNDIWDPEYTWCKISVYDRDNNLITTGHDILEFKGEPFYMECNKDIEGFNCYGRIFELELGYNQLTINVKPRPIQTI
jgi:hypothetical protein